MCFTRQQRLEDDKAVISTQIAVH